MKKDWRQSHCSASLRRVSKDLLLVTRSVHLVSHSPERTHVKEGGRGMRWEPKSNR